jgi:NAD+ synthase (glutamine-hydrolysing)
MKKITAVTMPGPGPTFGPTGTYQDAVDLINALGATFKEVGIEEQVTAHLRAIGHEPCWNCLQCENAQARERTQTVMDLGFTIGTGNLSESILGYCTYNGDQMSMYNPNCGIPKTLVNKLLKWIADKQLFGPEVSSIIYHILDKEASAELVKSDGIHISQITEEIIGQYPALDFDMYHFIRAGNSPRRLFQLVCEAFKGVYEPEDLLKWLETFLHQLLKNQFKRDASPNGPKVGTLSASPRADLRLPSDMAFPSSWRKFLDDMAKALAAEKA